VIGKIQWAQQSKSKNNKKKVLHDIPRNIICLQLIASRELPFKERSKLKRQSLLLDDFTFPYYQHIPSHHFKLSTIPHITSYIPFNLFLPVINIGSRHSVASFAIVPMPEATIDKNHFTFARKNNIWLSWQVFAMQPITKPHPIQHTSYD
jgi:hypothetical protein